MSGFSTAYPIAVTQGGTGSTTAATARTALSVPGLADNNTFTGSFTLSSAAPTFVANKSASGQNCEFSGQTAGNLRWKFQLGNSNTESGANAGSDFSILNYSDAGGFIGTACTILRASGNIAFPQHLTTASAANAFLDSGTGNLLRSTSSLRYKTDVEPLDLERAQAALALWPIWYRSNLPSDNPEHSWYGFAAEEVAKIDPLLVFWGYRPEDYEIVETEHEIVVPDTEEIDVPAIEVREGVAYRTTVKQQRQKVVTMPIFDDAGRGTGETIDVPLTRKSVEVRPERRLKEGAKPIPDGVAYDRVLLLQIAALAHHLGLAGPPDKSAKKKPASPKK